MSARRLNGAKKRRNKAMISNDPSSNCFQFIKSGWHRQIGLRLERLLPSTSRTRHGIELYKHLVQQVKYLNNKRVLPFEILMLLSLTQWEGFGVGLLRTLYKEVFCKQI